MKLQDVIGRAIKLFETPGRWIQGPNARDKEGNVCPWHHRDASKFDLEGALRWAAGVEHLVVWDRLMFTTKIIVDGERKTKRTQRIPGPLRRAVSPTRHVCDWNDEPGRTQGDVVELLHHLKKMDLRHEFEVFEEDEDNKDDDAVQVQKAPQGRRDPNEGHPWFGRNGSRGGQRRAGYPGAR